MLRRNICALIVIWIVGTCFTSFSQAQCPSPSTCTPTCADPCPCPTNSPAGICIVLSKQQFLDALAGTSTCSECTGGIPAHIKIPTGTRICLDEEILLGEEHEGIRITIDGTLTWSGPANEDKGMIKIQFTSNVVIDGSGLLDSVYDASGAIETPGDCFETIAWGVDIYVSQNITVSGTSASSPLKFRNLTGMVQAESAGAVQCSNRSCDITTKHLDGEEMSRYGVYWNADGVWIEKLPRSSADQ
jgi:hypothetical protein